MNKSLLYILLLCTYFLMPSCEKFRKEEQADTFFHISVEKTEIPVWVKGNTASGKLLVFINGGPGLSTIDIARSDMLGWSDVLEEEIAMVYYDQRGTANSQGRLEASDITLAKNVDDLVAIISVLETAYPDAEIYLMGHSFGSLIGIQYLMDPEQESRISGWISVDGAYNFDYDLKWQYRHAFLANIAEEELGKGMNEEKWQEVLDWTLTNPQITTDEQKEQWRNYIGYPGDGLLPEELTEVSVSGILGIVFASSYNIFPAYLSDNWLVTFKKLIEEVEGMNLIPEVGNITIPSLFICGRYDDLVPPEELGDVFDNLGTPDNKKHFELFPQSGHEPYASDPDNFKQAVVNFVLESQTGF